MAIANKNTFFILIIIYLFFTLYEETTIKVNRFLEIINTRIVFYLSPYAYITIHETHHPYELGSTLI